MINYALLEAYREGVRLLGDDDKHAVKDLLLSIRPTPGRFMERRTAANVCINHLKRCYSLDNTHIPKRNG